MWFPAETSLRETIRALKNDAPELLDRLKQLREHHMNKSPPADTVDQFRGRIAKGDIFLHYGVFPSDGNLDEVQSPSLANEFARECEAYFSSIEIFTDEKKAVQRIASWLYLACPPVIIESARNNLRRGIDAILPVDLHTMGLCFIEPSDINSFFAALEQIFIQEHTHINEWLRTSRNIVRFRDHALKPEIVSRNRLDDIFSGIFKSLESEVKGSNFKMIFNNCVLLSLYLLKRRRYEPDFLSSDSAHFRKLDGIFSMLINKKRNALSNRQFKIVSISLKFLRHEASYADLQGVMIEVSKI